MAGHDCLWFLRRFSLDRPFDAPKKDPDDLKTVGAFDEMNGVAFS